MLWLKIGWRNLWRNPSRSIIQLLVISGSLAFVIWMQNVAGGTYEKMIQDAVRCGSGHLNIHHPKYVDERLTEMYFDLKAASKVIAGNGEILNAVPRLHVPGLARSSHENAAAMILGIDFSTEAKFNPLLSQKRLVSGSLPADDTTNRAYIGYKLAQRLKIKAEKKFVVMFQDFSGEISSKLYRISGIFKSGVAQIDNSTVFVDRKSLATGLGNPDAAHELALIIRDPGKIDILHAELQKACPSDSRFKVFRWEETSKQLADTIKMDQAQFRVMIFLLFVLVAIGTVNLLLMSILERTREFGLLQAIGMEKARIKHLIFAEGLVLGLVGSTVGFTVAAAASFYSWYYGLDMSAMFGNQEVAGLLFEPIITSNWNWCWMFGLSLGMIILVLAASIYPARKALRVNPTEAMRTF